MNYHLVGEYGFAPCHRLHGREFFHRDFAPVYSPKRNHFKDLINGTARFMQLANNPPGLVICRHEHSRFSIENQDSHGRRC